MASHEHGVIEQATQLTGPNTVTVEDKPLLQKNKKLQRILFFQRFRQSILIKSRAANMILFWNTLVILIFGLFDPGNVFVFLFNLFEVHPFFTRDVIVFYIIIGSGVYGVIAFWLLFYPLAGYLADVRFGRYKVVMCGLKTMWGLLLSLIICGVVLALTVILLKCLHSNSSFCNNDIFLHSFIALASVLYFVAYVAVLIGFAAFAANVIQFGIDQLQDSPARDCFLFIHWFLFASYFGIGLGKIAYSMGISTAGYSFIFYFAFVLLLFLISVPVSLCIAKRRWFITDSGIGNPYKEVARVVSFARKHKIPIRRSAFTYWEDDIPTGLDLGKSKYGGPFTTEQVENVKSFFGILYILLSLGPFFAVDIAASVFLLILKQHMTGTTSFQYHNGSLDDILDSFSTGNTLYPVIIVVLLPVYLKIIHPLLQRYGILKRIGFGLCLITINLMCSLLVDSIGHVLPSGKNSTSVFEPQQFSFDEFKLSPVPLNISPQFLIIQQVLLAMAYILIYGGVFEFICAQSPHSMKGLLIGISFAVKGVFQLIGVLGILLPFSFWVSSPRAGLVYFSVNILISVVGVVAFTVAAKRYQYRQRDEFCNIRKFIEEFYEKDVRHNREFEELDVNSADN